MTDFDYDPVGTMLRNQLLAVESEVRQCVADGFDGVLAHWITYEPRTEWGGEMRLTLNIQRFSRRVTIPCPPGVPVTVLDMREAREALATLIAKSVDDEDAL